MEELSFMTLKSDAKFEKKLTYGLENNMTNQANFPRELESLKIWTLMGSFYPKQNMYELKNFKLCIMTMKNDAKLEEELTCCSKIDSKI